MVVRYAAKIAKFTSPGFLPSSIGFSLLYPPESSRLRVDTRSLGRDLVGGCTFYWFIKIVNIEVIYFSSPISRMVRCLFSLYFIRFIASIFVGIEFCFVNGAITIFIFVLAAMMDVCCVMDGCRSSTGRKWRFRLRRCRSPPLYRVIHSFHFVSCQKSSKFLWKAESSNFQFWISIWHFRILNY